MSQTFAPFSDAERLEMTLSQEHSTSDSGSQLGRRAHAAAAASHLDESGSEKLAYTGTPAGEQVAVPASGSSSHFVWRSTDSTMLVQPGGSESGSSELPGGAPFRPPQPPSQQPSDQSQEERSLDQQALSESHYLFPDQSSETSSVSHCGVEVGEGAEPGDLPPSAGSTTHGSGKCKPCAFFHTEFGCKQGDNCAFCHLWHGRDRLKHLGRAKRGKYKALLARQKHAAKSEAGDAAGGESDGASYRGIVENLPKGKNVILPL